jgi:hypothetical protein
VRRGVEVASEYLDGPAINFDLLRRLAERPHPQLRIAEDFEAQLREIPVAWVGEVFTQARTAHHLLDLVGVPQGLGYASDLDCRTWLAITRMQELEGRLDRLITWHSRESGPGGMVGDFCVSCGDRWPCETRQVADGSYVDDVAEGVGSE